MTKGCLQLFLQFLHFGFCVVLHLFRIVFGINSCGFNVRIGVVCCYDICGCATNAKSGCKSPQIGSVFARKHLKEKTAKIKPPI